MGASRTVLLGLLLLVVAVEGATPGEQRCADLVPQLRSLQSMLIKLKASNTTITPPPARTTLTAAAVNQAVGQKLKYTLRLNAASDKVVMCEFYKSNNSLANLMDLLDTGYCTHILIFKFANIVKMMSEYTLQNIPGEGVKDLVSVKATTKTKFLLTIGDSTFETGQMLSKLVSDDKDRASFIVNIITFLKEYGFDGLNFNWQNPATWNQKIKPADKSNFATLIKELYAAFKPLSFILTCIVPSDTSLIVKGFDMFIISLNVDWYIILTSSYRGTLEQKVGYSTLVKDFESTLQILRTSKLSIRGLVFQIAIQPLSFLLQDPTKYKTGHKAKGANTKGPWLFSQVCTKITEEKWTVSNSLSDTTTYYMYKGDQWSSFDDVGSVQRKARYINTNMAGAMVESWADDFNGSCGCGNYPLLAAITEELRGQKMKLNNCVVPNTP